MLENLMLLTFPLGLVVGRCILVRKLTNITYRLVAFLDQSVPSVLHLRQSELPFQGLDVDPHYHK